jgi:hypothetical protein
LAPTHALSPDALLSALWPVALGASGALLLLRVPLPVQPPGDLLHLAGGLRHIRLPRPVMPRARPVGRRLATLLVRAVARGERRLLRWQVGGAALPFLALLLLGLLAAGA